MGLIETREHNGAAGGESSASGARVGFTLKGFVRMEVELHVRGPIDDGGVRKLGNVIEEPIKLCHGIFGWIRLLRCQFGYGQ